MKSILPTFLLLCLATAITAQSPNNTLRGKVLYQSSGSKPAVGVRIAEPDATAVFSLDNGDYSLVFQNKRNGAALALEIGKDDGKSQKLELVNEKEVKAAKLPASKEEALDIIVCPAGQRDIAAQKYYRILRTTADRELERKKKEVEGLLAQKEKDFQKISDLFAQLDRMQAALDSAKIREQAFSIASINLDRASQLVKDAVQKIEEENDVEEALRILNVGALDTAYQQASALKKRAEEAIRQVIEGYEFKISLLEPQFKYGEIAECYERIARICEQEKYFDEYLAEYFDLIGESLRKNGEYRKSKDFFQKSLSVREKTMCSDNKVRLSYANLAVAYQELGEYSKALEYNMLSSSLAEKIYPINHAEFAIIYNNMAWIYGELGNFQKQLEFNQKAINILEKNLKTEDPLYITSLSNLASTYLYLGDNKAAVELYNKVILIQESIQLPNLPSLATSYSNLASTYGRLGEHQKRLILNNKAFTIREKYLPENHPELAKSFNNLGVNYYELGEYQKGLELCLKALDIRAKVLPEIHSDMAQSYNNIAQGYSKIDENIKALEFNLKAMAVWKKTLPSNHPTMAISYSNVGYAYRGIGDFPKSLEYLREAILIGESLNPKHQSLFRFYGRLGIVLVESRNFAEAKLALEKSESLKNDAFAYQGWAIYHSAQMDKIKTFENLKKAVDLGFKDLHWIENTESLACIRNWAAYKSLVEQLKKQ